MVIARLPLNIIGEVLVIRHLLLVFLSFRLVTLVLFIYYFLISPVKKHNIVKWHLPHLKRTDMQLEREHQFDINEGLIRDPE